MTYSQLSYLCLLFIFLAVQTTAFSEDIDVLVLLPQNNSYIFSISMVRPAIEYAKKMISSENGFYSGLNFSIQYENSGCGNDALFTLVDRSIKKKPDLILGPVCVYAAADVIRLASHWNIPVISAGALASGFSREEYSHLTRVAPSYMKMAETFSAMFRHFRWQNTVLIFEDDIEERKCYFMLEAIHIVLNLLNVSTHAHSIYNKRYSVDTDEIIKHIRENEVIIMCAGADVIRDIMLVAHRWKLTKGHYIYFSIDLFNSSSYGNRSWRRGDTYDLEAKQAYASLNVVTMLQTDRPQFQNFSAEVMGSVQRTGSQDHGTGININVFVEGFQDALRLYALGLHEAIKNGYSKRDGKQVTRAMWNRTFEGITGQVSIDASGDRHGDFSVISMTDRQAGTYSAVLNYFGINGSLQMLPGFDSNRFALTEEHRPSTSICSDDSCGSTVMGIIIGVILGALLVVAFYIFRRKYKIVIERRCRQEGSILAKHHKLREDSITVNFSVA